MFKIIWLSFTKSESAFFKTFIPLLIIVLDKLLKDLEYLQPRPFIGYGNPDADITILISTGCHRATTKDELIAKFGEDIVAKEDLESFPKKQIYFWKIPDKLI